MTAIAAVGKSGSVPVSSATSPAAAGLWPMYISVPTSGPVCLTISRTSRCIGLVELLLGAAPGSRRRAPARRAARSAGCASPPSRSPSRAGCRWAASQRPAAALSRSPRGRRARSKSGPPGSSPALACRITISLWLSCMPSIVGHDLVPAGQARHRLSAQRANAGFKGAASTGSARAASRQGRRPCVLPGAAGCLRQ